MTYYNTDGRGKLIEGHVSWDSDEWGEPVRYEGPHPNLSHDLAFRRKYHVPAFLREAQRRESPYFIECWISTIAERPALARAVRKYGFVNVPHYNQNNELLQGALTFMENEMRSAYERPTFQPVPDLGPGQLQHEIVLETVVPKIPLPHRLVGGHGVSLWDEAMFEWSVIPDVLCQMTKRWPNGRPFIPPRFTGSR